MATIYNTQCCGVREIAGLGGGAIRVIKDIMTARYSGANNKYFPVSCAIMYFTDQVKAGNGEALYKYIIEHKLGHVIESPIVNNPNSHNDIKMWLWIHDNNALIAWAEANIIIPQ